MPSNFQSSKYTTLKDLLFLAPLALFFLLFRLGNGSLASWDEALYAAVSREMLASGDWLKLTFLGSPWFDKPPLAIWATTFFYKIFGVSEFASRLFSALCGVGTVLVMYFFGRKLFNRWTGLCGALVLLSSSHFLRFARFGMLDTPLVFFMTLSFFLFWLGQSENRYLILSGIPIGLAVLVKGFAGILIFPVLGIYMICSGRLEILTRRAFWLGIVVAAAIALPWNLYEFYFYHDQFMRDVVTKHLVSRTTGALDGHTGNFYYYIRTLVNKYHPWILIGIFSGPLFLWKSFKDREDEVVFVTVWMFFIFAVVTLVSTKLGWYVLPVYPALSLSVAYCFTRVFKEKHAPYAKLIFLAVLGIHAFYSRILDTDYSRPIKDVSPLVSQMVPTDQPVFLYRYHEQPAAVYYFQRNVQYAESSAEFEAAATGKKQFYCFARAEDAKGLDPIASRLGISSVSPFSGFYFYFIDQK